MNILIIIFLIISFCGCAPRKLLYKKDQGQDHFSNPYVGDEVTATALSYDSGTGKIKYILPSPALVRIRIGIRDGGPLLRNFVEWEPRQAGAHEEIWNMKDETGMVDFKNNNKIMVTVQCVKPDAPSKPSTDFRRTFHKGPKLTLEFPDAVKAQVKGRAVLRVSLDPQDKIWLKKTRYEMCFYVDHVFMVEEEEAVDPVNYQIDTTKFNNGVHVITVNVTAYTGEIGTMSIPIDIENDK